MRKTSMKRRIQRNRRSAFTLLEVMLVLVILAAIAGIAVVNLGGIQDSANKKLVQTQISGLKTACEQYRLEVGQYPSTLNDLYEQPSDLPDPSKWVQIYKEPIKPDPWNNELEYENSGADYVIKSGGPDGKMGTDDDITS